MKLSALKSRTRTLEIPVSGEEGEPDEIVKVIYRPGEITLEVSDNIKEAIASGFEADAAYAVLKPILVSWDLQDEDGSPLPVTEETLRIVPLTFLGLVMAAVEDDARPNLQRGVTSQGTLSQMVPPDASQNGTSFSEPQTGSDADLGNSLVSQ